MRLDFFGAKKYVRMECEGAGIGVQFHQHGTIKSPHTDGRTLHVHEPNGMWTEEQWDEWEYEVYHEIGHEAPENRKPHWKAMLKSKGVKKQTLLTQMWNLISDHVQEHNRVGVYRGRDKVLKRGRMRFVNSRLLQPEFMEAEAESKAGSVFKVAAIYDTMCRETWNEYLSGMSKTCAEALTGEEEDMFQTLYNSGIKIEEATNEEEAYEIAKQILDLFDFDTDEMEKEAQETEDGEGEGEEAEGGEGSGKEGEGEGEGREGEGEEGKKGKEGKGKGKKAGGLTDKEKEEISKVLHHTHYGKPKDDSYDGNGSSDQHITYKEIPEGYGSFTPKDPVIVDLKKEDYNGYAPNANRVYNFTNAINAVDGGKLLAGQVKRLLISMKQRRWDHGHKRGHISGKNLWKAKRPIYGTEVFKKRANVLELDTAVTVLTDNSGSMSGYKFAHAARAGIMLNEAMSKIGVPVELLSFSEGGRGPLNIIVKPFNEVSINEDRLVERYATCGSWMMQNSDGESILWAHDRLVKRKEKRRVLIVLSDGSPAAHNGGYGEEVGYTKAVIEKIEESSPVEIYGIGIMDTNVSKFYTDYKVLNKAEELEDMLIGLVKSKLLK